MALNAWTSRGFPSSAFSNSASAASSSLILVLQDLAEGEVELGGAGPVGLDLGARQQRAQRVGGPRPVLLQEQGAGHPAQGRTCWGSASSARS